MKKASIAVQRAIALTLATLLSVLASASFSTLATAAAAVPVISMETGVGNGCAIAVNGDAYCWGTNLQGQLGDETQTDSLRPIKVGGGLTWKSIVSGEISSCGITTTDDAYCWGSSYYFNLGQGSNSNSFTPVAVTGGLKWSSLTLTAHTTCGIRTNGTAACWGLGTSGQAGNAGYFNQMAPYTLAGTWKSISAGKDHSCGVKADDLVYCWGEGDNGRLGTGNTTDTNSPTLVSGGGTWASVSAGYFSTCAVRIDGSGYCWGIGGSIGDGTSSERLTPTPVSGGYSWSSISVGNNFACGVLKNGDGKCWGSDFNEKLGDGTGPTAQVVPASIAGSYSWRTVSASDDFGCGVLVDGTTQCWGNNGSRGKLGDGTTTTRATPVLVLLYLLNNVSVSGTVNPMLSFTVSGRATACNGETVTGSSIATAIDLGRITGTAKASAGQSLSVSTNAALGSKILIRASGPLTNQAGGTIPWKTAGFTAFPSAGTAAAGYTVDWTTPNTWSALDSTNGEVFSDAVVGTTFHCVAYQAQAAANTAAGSYGTTVFYTVVPQF